MTEIADIGVSPWEDLSNFEPHGFIFRGTPCASMEGLLQSLKFPILKKQERVRALSGTRAKFIGKKKKWYLDQKLYWLDTIIDRHSSTYTQLIEEAFLALYKQNKFFRDRLNSTASAELTHSHGKSDPRRTILTESEFVRVLTKIRHSKFD